MSEYTQYDEVESGESLLAVLDEITVIVENAKSVPLSSSALINRNEILELLHNAVDVLPSQLVEAHNMLQEKEKVSDNARENADRLIAEAREQAKHIISQAKAQAERLVSRDSVVIKARQQATKILDETKSKAARITNGANEYSDSTLAEVAMQLSGVEEYLAQIQVQIEAGRDVLAKRREAETEAMIKRENEPLDSDSENDLIHSRSTRAGGLHSYRADARQKEDPEKEFNGTELDFATVQAEYARMENSVNTAESVETANTAIDPAKDEMPEKMPKNHENKTENTASAHLPEILPEDFDYFEPELEFTEENNEYKS